MDIMVLFASGLTYVTAVLIPLLIAVILIKQSCNNKIEELREIMDRRVRDLKRELQRELVAAQREPATNNAETSEPAASASQTVAERASAREEAPKPVIEPTPTPTVARETHDAQKPTDDVLPRLELDLTPRDDAKSTADETSEPLALDAFLNARKPAEPAREETTLPPISLDEFVAPPAVAEPVASESVASPRVESEPNESKPFELASFLGASSTPDARESRTAPSASADKGRRESNASAFELFVGRKFLAWVAVFLFLLGSAFFVQVAIQNGLLNPTNRCVGLVLLGSAFLLGGRRLHSKGMRRYAETLTSSGIVTFILTGYYAMRAQVAPFEVDVAIMIATVFGGFMIAGLYRSAVVGFVAALGGAVTPFLIERGMEPGWLTTYLLAYFGSGLILVNWLKRSSLALVPWLGALLVFYAHTEDYPHGRSTFYAMTAFLIGFYVLELFDHLGLFLSRRRELRAFDLIRTALSPVIVTLGFWQACDMCQFSDVTLASLNPLEFFNEYGKYITLGFCAFYTVMTLLVAPRFRALCKSAPTEPDGAVQLKFALAATGVLKLRGVYLTLAFLFFSVTLSLFITTTRVFLITWSSLAVCALLGAGRALSGLRAPGFVLALPPGGARDRLAAAYIKTHRRHCSIAIFYSAIFFALACVAGLTLISQYRFYSLAAFIEPISANRVAYLNAYPFVNAIAAPTTLAALILLGASFAFTRLFGGARHEDGSRELGITFFGTIYILVGACALLMISASEIYAYATTLACQADCDAPALVGCSAILIVWAAVAFVLYLFGAIMDAPRVRFAARVTTGILVVKLLVFNLIKHPLLDGGSLVPLVFEPSHTPSDLPYWVFTSVADERARPLLNPYSLPFVLVGALGLLFALVGRYARANSYRAKPGANEASVSALWGTFGFFLLVGISCLDAFAWFHFRPSQFGAHDFYAWRSIWVLLLVFAYVSWAFGRLTRNALPRWLCYALLLFDLAFVTWGEFFTGDWRTNHETITSAFNPYACFAAAYFVSLLILGMRRNQVHARDASPSATLALEQERRLIGTLAVIGLAGLVALASFETYRYFTGFAWYGSTDVSRLLALSTLWTLAIILFLAFGRGKSQLCAWFAGVLMLLLFVKFFAFDISRIGGFRVPFFNPFTLATAIPFVAFLYGAHALGRFTRRELANASAPEYGKHLERVNSAATLTSFIVALALIQALVGSSVDVWRGAEFFPRGPETPLAFMAQTALSVLWSVFATALLIIGFLLNNRMLRWFAILLYGLTTFKALTIDLSYLESIYRVVAIFALAFALMFAAYWYNRRRGGGANNAGE